MCAYVKSYIIRITVSWSAGSQAVQRYSVQSQGGRLQIVAVEPVIMEPVQTM